MACEINTDRQITTDKDATKKVLPKIGTVTFGHPDFDSRVVVPIKKQGKFLIEVV